MTAARVVPAAGQLVWVVGTGVVPPSGVAGVLPLPVEDVGVLFGLPLVAVAVAPGVLLLVGVPFAVGGLPEPQAASRTISKQPNREKKICIRILCIKVPSEFVGARFIAPTFSLIPVWMDSCLRKWE